MASSLKENYDSDYVRLSNRLTGRKRTVEVWVEDEYDVPFWNDLLSAYPDIDFRITPYQNGDLNKGKGTILKNMRLLGPHLVACVDSDYDYLLPDASENGRRMSRNPYVAQTFSYSVENFNCHPATLRSICTNATMGSTDFDFETFYVSFSRAVYPLLLWSLTMRKVRNCDALTLSDFKNIVGIRQNVIEDNAGQVLQSVSRRVEKACRMMEKKFAWLVGEKRNVETAVRKKGVTPDNCFLFVNGHILQDSVTMRLLTPICRRLTNQHIELIFQSRGPSGEKKRKKEHYDNITRRSLPTLLASNFGYKQYGGIYEKLLRPRLDKLVETLRQSVG